MLLCKSLIYALMQESHFHFLIMLGWFFWCGHNSHTFCRQHCYHFFEISAHSLLKR